MPLGAVFFASFGAPFENVDGAGGQAAAAAAPPFLLLLLLSTPQVLLPVLFASF